MRRSAMPIGWARRDPWYYRFALPNAVWECKLNPVEFVIFLTSAITVICC